MKTSATSGMLTLLGLALLLPVPEAYGQMKFCNKSAASLSAAVGFPESSGQLTARGWYNIDPGACIDVLDGPLSAAEYFAYAESKTGEWSGDVDFCVHPTNRFETARGNCAAQGYKTAALIRISTHGSPEFTFNFTAADPPAVATPASPPPAPSPAVFCARPAAPEADLGASYGRGFGFGYIPLFEGRADAKRRCESEHGACERCLEMYYPVCAAGYHPVGCNVCARN